MVRSEIVSEMRTRANITTALRIEPETLLNFSSTGLPLLSNSICLGVPKWSHKTKWVLHMFFFCPAFGSLHIDEISIEVVGTTNGRLYELYQIQARALNLILSANMLLGLHLIG